MTAPGATLSPLVDIQSRLVQESETEVFTVRSDRRAYWRLTALDAFDGRALKSSRRFSCERRPAGADAGNAVTTTVVQQQFDIGGLSQIWLPAAYEPRELDALGLLTRWEPSTSTLIVDRQTSDGLQYRVTSAHPNYLAGDLRQATGLPPRRHRRPVPGAARRLQPQGRGARRPGDQPGGHALRRGAGPAGLLPQRRASPTPPGSAPGTATTGSSRSSCGEAGYCEQFAGAFAAMARSIGSAARSRLLHPRRGPFGPALFHVKGKHATPGPRST